MLMRLTHESKEFKQFMYTVVTVECTACEYVYPVCITAKAFFARS